MMRVASLHAFDVMSTVQATLLVKEYPDDPEGRPSTVLECTTTFPGIGETDPRLWAKDALIAMLEAL